MIAVVEVNQCKKYASRPASRVEGVAIQDISKRLISKPAR